ncbi:MAG: hypothetical protein GDA43_26640 [Hormoscilla sp. SP5CHS1]|nr:hypothetical protein [Hormoscilla sp. SP5CHS1]
MTQPDIEQILEKLNEINTRLERLERLESSVERLERSVEYLERSADLAEAYRQGTQWVVNLAFSLIVATTIGIILKFVLGS